MAWHCRVVRCHDHEDQGHDRAGDPRSGGRQGALELLAFAIENADDERPNARSSSCVRAAVAFGRTRMSAIYRYLRGLDPTTGDANIEHRRARLVALDRAADECLHPTTWRDYMLRVVHAGLISRALVSSDNAVVNAYAFYVQGHRIGIRNRSSMR